MRPWVLQERCNGLWYGATAGRRFKTADAAIQAVQDSEAYITLRRHLRVILLPRTGSNYTYTDHHYGEVLFERRIPRQSLTP